MGRSPRPPTGTGTGTQTTPTYTVDQLFRTLLASSPAGSDDARAEGDPPGETGPVEPLPAVLRAAAAEVAAKRANELQRGEVPGGPSRDDALETSTRAAETLSLGFHLGAALERIAVAATEGSAGVLRLREAAWLIERYATLLEQRPLGADIQASSVRLALAAETISGLRELAAEVEAPAPEPRAEPEPATAAVPVPPAPDEPPVPVQVVHELPSIPRELFVTAARAAIAVAAITVLVLALTLIAQWR